MWVCNPGVVFFFLKKFWGWGGVGAHALALGWPWPLTLGGCVCVCVWSCTRWCGLGPPKKGGSVRFPAALKIGGGFNCHLRERSVAWLDLGWRWFFWGPRPWPWLCYCARALKLVLTLGLFKPLCTLQPLFSHNKEKNIWQPIFAHAIFLISIVFFTRQWWWDHVGGGGLWITAVEIAILAEKGDGIFDAIKMGPFF